MPKEDQMRKVFQIKWRNFSTFTVRGFSAKIEKPVKRFQKTGFFSGFWLFFQVFCLKNSGLLGDAMNLFASLNTQDILRGGIIVEWEIKYVAKSFSIFRSNGKTFSHLQMDILCHFNVCHNRKEKPQAFWTVIA